MTKEKTTKDLIFEAAVHLFSIKGFHGTSIRDLAKEVGIKESSIYNHFPGKNAILEEILEYHISGFQDAMFSREEMDATAAGINDPVELWITGTKMFMKRLPPLSQEITTILYNEMFLNQQCRKFVLEIMFTAQKDLTAILLEDLYKKGLIKKCDFQKTAVQYVYMIYGMNIEHRLRTIEGKNQEAMQHDFIENISFFIEQLK